MNGMNESIDMNNAPLSKQLIALAEFWCEDVPYHEVCGLIYELEVTPAISHISRLQTEDEYWEAVKHASAQEFSMIRCYLCLLEAEFQKDKEIAIAKMMENILA